MEIRELAERVLFGSTLEEKLTWPGVLTDEAPGAPGLVPEMPARPPELRFKAERSGSGAPKSTAIHDDLARGRLLHFFANHELLATELMALVLWKFPDAPPAFRRGVAQTLKDEQAHTRMYLARMRECGVRFGELPVSGYFWKAISRMESPMDFVSGLSLTFEQANLDYSREFAQAFAAAGDEATARLLRRIHDDEIGHVAHGLKWFRLWKDPGESDWEAFQKQLVFPLAPSRAKGRGDLNVEARLAAGLSPEFIAELRVSGQSRGRTPAVFVFNPFEEGRWARGMGFNPRKTQARMAKDLASLPQFLCRRDDVVLVPTQPRRAFLESIQQAGFPIPEFSVLAGTFEKPRVAGMEGRKFWALRPWAWGPGALELFAALADRVRPGHGVPPACANGRLAQLCSKAWSAELLARALRGHEGEAWLAGAGDVGIQAANVAEALEAIRTIRAMGHRAVVVKEALGVAGHNAIRLLEPEVSEAQERWMERATCDGRLVVVEPWVERLLDFSIQWEMSGTGLALKGFTGLRVDAKGQYRGNWAAWDRGRPPAGVARLLAGHGADIGKRVKEFYLRVAQLLEDALREAEYAGPVGVDAFVFRDREGRPRLKPIVEVNPRYTMGRLALELLRQTAPGSRVEFRLVTLAEARREGDSTLAAYARRWLAGRTLRLEGAPTPKLAEGALCLNDPETAEACLATLEVTRQGAVSQ